MSNPNPPRRQPEDGYASLSSHPGTISTAHNAHSLFNRSLSSFSFSFSRSGENENDYENEPDPGFTGSGETARCTVKLRGSGRHLFPPNSTPPQARGVPLF